MKFFRSTSDVKEKVDLQPINFFDSQDFPGMGLDFDALLGGASRSSSENKSAVETPIFFDEKYRKITDVVIEKNLASIFNSILRQASHTFGDQVFGFNIELSDGKRIDVKSEYKGGDWVFALVVKDRSLRRKLMEAKGSLSHLLKKSLGARVYVDVF